MAMETGLVDYVVPVLYLAFSVMLIVAGAGLFTMASWTRRVAVWACSGILLTLSINILFGSWGRPQDVFEAIGAVIGVLVTLFWPLFMLIFMNLDSVRRQVEGPVAGEQEFFGAPPAGGPRG